MTAQERIPSVDGGTMLVGDLERTLLRRWPQENAEPWDRVGLSVGDPTAPLTGVACALDVTPASIARAAELGDNLLLTHHPVCLEMPAVIAPASSGAPTPASSIWEAVEHGVSLIAMHTNLDRAAEAALRLPEELGLADRARAGIERGRAEGAGSLGALVELAAGEMTVDGLARRCLQRLGRVAQVYGDPSLPARRIAFYSGSLGSQGMEDVRAARADVVVCGECGYHRALDLVSGGCAAIILGHDVSELPHVSCLRRGCLAAGVPEGRVHVIAEPARWTSFG